MPSSIVVGHRDDPHVVAVLSAVEAAGGACLLFDASTLASLDFALGRSGVEIHSLPGEEGPFGGGAQTRGWLRRLAPEEWHSGAAASGHDAVIQQAWTTTVAAVAEMSGIAWLSPLSRVFEAENKLLQQRACEELGIAFPPAVLTTRRQRIPPEFGERLVVKPFGAGHFLDGEGRGRVVHATEMRRDDSRLELLAGAPFLVQPLIDADAHLRVVTVGGDAYVARLDASDLPLDWRAADAAHSSFTPASEPSLAQQAIELALLMSVGYSSQDWVIDKGGAAQFLDLNPAGQWLFLPAEVSGRVTERIANWLVGDD